LIGKIGSGFSVDTLELMRRFYLKYQNIDVFSENSETLFRISQNSISETLYWKSASEKQSPMILQNITRELLKRFTLTWSHYITLSKIDNIEERQFYEIESSENSWGVRELQRQLNSGLYERLCLSRNKEQVKELSQKGLIIEKPLDIIKNPFVLEFLGFEEKSKYSENQLETAIIDKLESFLLELGKGFLFEARQKRFTFDEDHFYVDLVFYNRLLKCYVLIDLKLEKLTHQDLGQMQMYVNYFDRYAKTEDENPTIGIVLCKSKNDAVVELTLPKDANIYASKYQLYLPSKEELKKQLEEAEREFIGRK